MTLRTAVILCGGKGTRLGTLGKKISKTLIKIQGYPILWFIINALKKNKFNHFILPIGHKGEQIKKYIKKNPKFKNDYFELIPTGNNTFISKRIYKIKNFIKSENFLLLNGDAIFYSNIDKIYNEHLKKKFDISFICSEAEADFGTVGMRNGKIVNFKRGLMFGSVKIKNKKNFSGFVYSGMAIINKKILKERFLNKTNFEKEFYPKIIKKYNCNMFNLNGFWHAMDNLKDINTINNNKENQTMFRKIKNIIKKLKK